MINLGNENIAGLYLGGQKIARAYLGSGLVFDAAPAPAVYTVTVTIDPAGSGTVTGAGQYQEGESVTVRATAADGMALSKWQVNGQDVGTGASYTFTVTEDVEVVAVFEKYSHLPAGYTELQYIESDNQCCIDTGLSLGAVKTKRVVLDLQPNSYTTSGEYICAYPWANAAVSWYLVRISDDSFRAKVGNYSGTLKSTSITGSRAVIDWDQANAVFSVNGNSTTAPTGANNANFSGNIYIFAPGPSYSDPCISAKLFSAKIYNSGSLVRDLVPCKKSDGTIGLFDLVGNNFCPNSGTGVLTAGPTV